MAQLVLSRSSVIAIAISRPGLALELLDLDLELMELRLLRELRPIGGSKALRIRLLLRVMLGTRWEAETWPPRAGKQKREAPLGRGFSRGPWG